MSFDNLKKKVITVLIGAGTLLGIFAATKYENPADIIKEQIEKKEDVISQSVAIESTKNVKSKLDKIPVVLRTILLFPLWFIGNLILKLLDRIVKLVAQPFLALLLSTLFTFLILLLVIVLFIKLLYPNLSLKEILNKKLIITVLLCSFIINAADLILNKTLDNYESIKNTIRFILGAMVIFLISFNIIRKKIKDVNKPKIIYDEVVK